MLLRLPDLSVNYQADIIGKQRCLTGHFCCSVSWNLDSLDLCAFRESAAGGNDIFAYPDFHAAQLPGCIVVVFPRRNRRSLRIIADRSVFIVFLITRTDRQVCPCRRSLSSLRRLFARCLSIFRRCRRLFDRCRSLFRYRRRLVDRCRNLFHYRRSVFRHCRSIYSCRRLFSRCRGRLA